MISNRRFRDMPARHAAQELSLLLESARAYLTTFRARVCPRCHHVFSPDHRLDMRCPGCAAAVAEKEQVLP